MLRIAIQSKGRLYEESMALLEEAGIKIPGGKRTLLVPARNFPVEEMGASILYYLPGTL